MIPVRLSLHNFLCYRDVEALDFTGFQLACLSGENGHGKSAILDAMTWALWGKARAGTDELVHFNETEMEVEFEFILEDRAYRVIRKRNKRTRAGQSQLELQAEADGEFHPITETSMRKTQTKVNELLRMDYDTFVNSAFLLQGRADEFTTKTPMQRKDILADILGLSIYDKYETLAKDRANEKDNEARLIEAQIAEWRRELAQRPAYEQELAEAETKAVAATERLAALGRQVQSLREERQRLETRRDQSLTLVERIERTRGELADLQQRLVGSRESIAGYEKTLSERDRIENGYRDLVAARNRQGELDLQLQEVLELNQRKAEFNKAVEAERQELLVRKSRLEDRAAELKRRADRRDRYTAELREMEAPFNNLAQVEVRRSELNDQLAKRNEEVARLEAQTEGLQAGIQESSEKQALLSAAEAQCPLCLSDLTEEHRQRLLSEVQSLEADKRRVLEATEGRISELRDSAKSLASDIRKADQALHNLPGLRQRKAKVEAALDEAVQAAVDLDALRPEVESLSELVQGSRWALEARSQLKALEEELAAVGYDEEAHREVRSAVKELSVFDDERTRLIGAEEQVRQEKAHEEGLKQLEESRRKEIELAETQARALSEELRRWDECVAELAEGEEELSQLRVEEAQSRQVLGAARQKLDTCRDIERMTEEKAEERKAVLSEKTIHDELRLAFGKRGVQAMIIETVIPEIEDEANAILFRMTDGRMRIKLDTQRETKSKSVVETLDITVSDELGSRAYELYSGGEAFRIDFALRVGLSKLLARRAGASLRTLVIDEGFGTQDTHGRERLIESINAIRDDFDKILVVTHIDELKDAFPVHIEVFKTPTGSQIVVT